MVVADVLVVGSDEGTTLALRDDGCIVSIDSSTHQYVRLVCSSALALVGCIRAYRDFGSSIAACSSEAEEQACVIALEANLRDVDPTALSNPENWWSCIIDQARDGML